MRAAQRTLFVAALLTLAPRVSLAQERNERALEVARTVERVASTVELWPGFEPLEIPLAIYDGKDTYLFRHASPPAGFEPRAGMTGVLVFAGRYPSVVANSSADIGGTLAATVMLDRVEPSRSAESLAAMALHETFHVYQRSHHPRWTANEADLFVYPTDDAQLLAQRRLETEALRRALAADADGAVRCWAGRSLALRHDRYAAMGAAFAAYERGTELNEGLATYVELRALGSAVDIPRREFAAADVRGRAYLVGAALGELLDRFEPGWQASLGAADGDFLDAALARALGLEHLESCAFAAADVAAAEAAARANVHTLLAQRSASRERFEKKTGWRIVIEAAAGQPLWPQGFDPLNVERIDGGVLHTRYLRLGNDAGKMEAVDTNEADIEVFTEAAGSHPLFNGVRRVVLTGMPEPKLDTSNGSVALTAPGLSANFAGAAVERAADTVTVRLGVR